MVARPETVMGRLRDRMESDLRLAMRAESTRKHYIGCARLFVKFFMVSPDKLGQADVRKFLLHLIDRKLSVGRYVQYLAAIRFLFTVTLQRPEVTAGIPWPRMRHRRIDVMTRDEVARVLAAAPTPYWRTFLTTAYAAGLRRREVAMLRAENIDSRSGLIRIVGTGKGEKSREVMLDPELLVQLRLHWRSEGLPGPWLFPRRACLHDGWSLVPVALDAASTAFRKARLAAKITRPVSLRSLRSAFATHLIEDGTDVFTLQQLLGHEDLDTTRKYTQVRTDRIRATPSPLSKLPK
jgi:site-specific recombinase XerD